LTQTRLALIEKVEEDDFSIAEAAKMLNIKLSTAKLIVTRFRKNGTVFMRKREQKEEREPHLERAPIEKKPVQKFQ
jgi:transposase